MFAIPMPLAHSSDLEVQGLYLACCWLNGPRLQLVLCCRYSGFLFYTDNLLNKSFLHN